MKIPEEAIEAVAPIIERMESRHPQSLIAQRVLEAAYPIIERQIRESVIDDVVEWLKSEGADEVDFSYAVKIEREFGPEPNPPLHTAPSWLLPLLPFS